MRRHPTISPLLALGASLSLMGGLPAPPTHAETVPPEPVSADAPADETAPAAASDTAGVADSAPVAESPAPPADAKPLLAAEDPPADAVGDPTGDPPGAASEPPEGTQAPSAGAPTNVPPTQAPDPNRITVSGVFDFYYLYQFSNPKVNNRLTGRIYDFRHNAPTLALAWVDVVKPVPAEGGFGFAISPAVGDSVDADHAEPGSGRGEARWKNLQQIYATYATRDGLTFDLGKYLSPYGYDTTKVILNYNYSVNLATFLVPNYVGGLRVNYPLRGVGKGSFLSAWIVNSIYHTNTSGINEDNGRPDLILRAGYTSADEKFTYIPAIGFGKDRLFNPAGGKGEEKVLLWDNWLTYKVTPATTLAAEYVYRKDDDAGGFYDLRANGYAFYVRHQVNPKDAVAFRYSGISNRTTNFNPAALGTTRFKVWEVTGTYERKLTPSLTTRIEYRHDQSNNAAAFGFADGDSAAPTNKQDTLAAALLWTF